jgi:hypothetical protein
MVKNHHHHHHQAYRSSMQRASQPGTLTSPRTMVLVVAIIGL